MARPVARLYSSSSESETYIYIYIYIHILINICIYPSRACILHRRNRRRSCRPPSPLPPPSQILLRTHKTVCLYRVGSYTIWYIYMYEEIYTYNYICINNCIVVVLRILFFLLLRSCSEQKIGHICIE